LPFSISKKNKGAVPRVPFELIKDACVGSPYALSLVFCDNKLSKKLNRVYRKKNKSTNILSFPLSNLSAGGSGEIFINLELARQEASAFGQTFSNFVGFLFIHGLMHLKGMEHGSTMEKAESKLRQKFKIHGSPNNSRH
jgi:probable rRNA maturation factor